MQPIFCVFTVGVGVKYRFSIANNSLFITIFLTEGYYLRSLVTVRLSKITYMKIRQILMSVARPKEK